MSEKHTEGPWEWDANVWDYDPEQEAPWLVSAGNDKVLFGQIGCTSEANARLIAAAPDLLDALAVLIELVSFQICDDGHPAIINARAAIAKATGGAS
jgi:hypothetical protein